MKLLLCFGLLFLVFGFLNAQTAARLIDSYDDKIPSGEKEQWHLEDFLKVLAAEPNATAYIVAYGAREDPPGKARRFALRAKHYMVEMRGIEPSRIVTLDGGHREAFVVELWLVPKSARPPEPRPTVTPSDDLGDNLLYDNIEVGYENFGDANEDDAARLDGFALALKKEPKAWGCIVAYAMAGNDQMGITWDTPGTGLKLAREHRDYLIYKHHLRPAAVSAVDGGYADRVVELWIMRPNARFDKGPFLYPDRLRANRNGTLTIGKSDTKGICCKACARGQTHRHMLKYANRHRAHNERRNRTIVEPERRKGLSHQA
ncbi:MAG TPA: hypothetical protein VHQ64_10470 [Pyrinomonadaceae bacterium]|jgi:hypothetical protein|nr:hypothetical protein [Pyrinomonadaceae bacterium]